MNVRINDARHHDTLACVVIGLGFIGRNTVDASRYYMNGRGANSLGRDHTPAADYRQAVSAQKRRRRFIDTCRR